MICVLGFGGYITYDKLLKDEPKNDEKIIKNDEQKVTEASEKTSDERYKEYLKNIPNVSDDELSKLNGDNYYSQIYNGVTIDGSEYNISLGNDKVLKLTIYNNSNLNNKNMVLLKMY